MSVRGFALLAGAAVLGLGGGYLYADAVTGLPGASGIPAPVAASGPAYPTTPAERLAPDADLPPLATEWQTTERKVGEPPLGVLVPVPVGWETFAFAGSPQTRFTAPGNVEAAYSVRVAVLSVNQTPEQMVVARAAQLPLDNRLSDLTFTDQTSDTLTFNYIINRHRVEQVIRWVSLSGGAAQVEIAASGRLIDDPGMVALVDRMAADVRRQPPEPRRKGDSSTGPAAAGASPTS